MYNVEYSKDKVQMKTKTLMKKLRDRQFKVVRVSKTEFELGTGDVFPFPFDMEEELTVEEFQTILDNSKELVLQMLGGLEDE